MPKRRRPPKPRARRSTFQSSLEYATAKLDKCLSRRVVLEAELEDLKKEIPYLQTVIRALTPRDGSCSECHYLTGHAAWCTSMPRGYEKTLPGPALGDGKSRGRAVHPLDELPPNLKPFVEPISIDELPAEEDQFLNTKLPPGEDLLS